MFSFDVTHPSLAAVKVNMFWQPASHPNLRETETEQERLLKLKPLIKMHSIKHHTDLDFYCLQSFYIVFCDMMQDFHCLQ